MCNLEDLNLGATQPRRQGNVRVTGKGNKQREIPVGHHACLAIMRWLPIRNRYARSGEDALFVSRNGTRMTPKNVQTRFARLARKYHLGKHLHPHILRHSFASHLLESSMSCGRCRSFQATATSAQLRFIPILIFSILRRSMTWRTRARADKTFRKNCDPGLPSNMDKYLAGEPKATLSRGSCCAFTAPGATR